MGLRRRDYWKRWGGMSQVPASANNGKIPSTIKRWRDNNGGTHAVMTDMYIPKGVDVDKEIFTLIFDSVRVPSF